MEVQKPFKDLPTPMFYCSNVNLFMLQPIPISYKINHTTFYQINKSKHIIKPSSQLLKLESFLLFFDSKVRTIPVGKRATEIGFYTS